MFWENFRATYAFAPVTITIGLGADIRFSLTRGCKCCPLRVLLLVVIGMDVALEDEDIVKTTTARGGSRERLMSYHKYIMSRNGFDVES